LTTQLNLKQQIGQMLVSGFPGTCLNSEVEELIETFHIGGFILFERNFEHPEQLAGLIADLQELASKSGAPAPLFISVDQEGGRVSRLKPPFTRFPEPCCLGIAKSESLAQRFGLALGQELNAVGINMDYAPVLDVNTNPDNPIIGKRAFSSDPDWAGQLGLAFMKGMQEAGVLPVGKHFPGHGDTSLDSHLALPVVDRSKDILEQVELPPFQQAIDNGLDVIMTAHVIYRAWDEKNTATFSPLIINNILRERLGFKGLVMSDDLEMKAVLDHVKFDLFPTQGLDAGLDLFLICHDLEKVKSLEKRMIEDVESGNIAPARIEQSCRRILAVKNKIPPPPAGCGNFFSLVESHKELVDEMQSWLK
jgi:beta-N-acetylhexosaminidase